MSEPVPDRPGLLHGTLPDVAAPDVLPPAGMMSPEAVSPETLSSETMPEDTMPEDTMSEADAEDAASVLGDLITAGLVSHEMIGDPARLGGETAALRALCAHIAGPVYRIDPYHYAFRAEAGDLDGRLADLAPGAWAGALEAALSDDLGAEAVWINPTDLLPEAGTALAQPLLMLRAQDQALRAGFESAGPGLQALVNARYAVECARLTADDWAGSGPSVDAGMTEALEARLVALEARQVEMHARFEEVAALAQPLAQLAETLAVVVQRLDAQSEVLHGHIARETRVAEALDSISTLAARPSDFEANVGVTLAEFLARIEQTQAEGAGLGVPLDVPQD